MTVEVRPADSAQAFDEVDRWTYEVESPFRPPHEVAALAAEPIGTTETEETARGEMEFVDEAVEELSESFAMDVEAREEQEEAGELGEAGEFEDAEESGPSQEFEEADELAAGQAFEEAEELDEVEQFDRQVSTESEAVGMGRGMAMLDEFVQLETGAGSSLSDRVRGVATFVLGPNLRRGAKGPAVAALQRALGTLGYDLAVDGDFGPNTERAVHAFQAKARLVVDGIVGPKTKSAISLALQGAKQRQGIFASIPTVFGQARPPRRVRPKAKVAAHVLAARALWKKVALPSSVVIDDIANAPSQLVRDASSMFGAWTNSATNFYVHPVAFRDPDQSLAVLWHESKHIKQFAKAGGPPTSYAQMMQYEREAYTYTAGLLLIHLQSQSKVWITDPAMARAIADDQKARGEDFRNKIQAVEKQTTDLKAREKEYLAWLTTPADPADPSTAYLPKSVVGKPIAALYQRS